ncbi:hypothetical protein HBH69_145110 [Parastagonospora nodorum]|nr:hypothetical protein HBI74_196100 [Parastagonospora nodorum]KAH5023000.1 hypothetical protein HBI75_156170 [Parastagonospora nodorum]KAH5152169.1 hypothetical protein HBH69_145110 [Parastagonospora nodorum]KAH5200055.1 hypothetical protein HBH77_131760 [Parastagonospora nodorum]KAH5452332.1 hypothetical protein HBI30_120490 [Parastagonospora nodorum]
MITTAALNISCSCTECNSFLRPISESTTPQGSGKEQTKSKIQDLYSPLEIDADYASREYMSIMTAFTAPFVPFVPTTPGLLHCTHVICTERIPVVPGTLNGTALCKPHERELRGSVRDMMQDWVSKEAEKQATAPSVLRARKTSIWEDAALNRAKMWARHSWRV